MGQINIRIDDDLKEQADKLFGSLGMGLTTAINVFISQAVREGGIPFTVTTRTAPFRGKDEASAIERQLTAQKFIEIVDEIVEE